MKQSASPITSKLGKDRYRSAVIHADPTLIKDIRSGRIDFFAKLIRILTQKGLPTRIVEANGQTANIVSGDDSLHIIAGNTPYYGPNVMHANPSYIWGFWYFDEIGVNANSSLRFAHFNPDVLDGEKAHYFYNGVTSYMLNENVSNLPQTARDSAPFAPAAAVVFCQDIETKLPRSHFLTTTEIIHTTAKTNGNDLVYVKLHPNQLGSSRTDIEAICAQHSNIRISNASIHDLIAASHTVITQNSAAGFEALMQRKPVITCARSDYWHATLTPKSTTDLVEAIEFGAEVMQGFEYEKYLYWFLAQNCLEPQKKGFGNRAWSRIRDKAFL